MIAVPIDVEIFAVYPIQKLQVKDAKSELSEIYEKPVYKIVDFDYE